MAEYRPFRIWKLPLCAGRGSGMFNDHFSRTMLDICILLINQSKVDAVLAMARRRELTRDLHLRKRPPSISLTAFRAISAYQNSKFLRGLAADRAEKRTVWP